MRNRRLVNPLLAALVLILLLSACAAPAAGGRSDAETTAPTAPAESAPADTAPEELKLVYAATTEELLRALRPDTEIHLTGRSYRLSESLGYGNFGGDYYDWARGYEGCELVISGLSNLSIIADRPGTEIVTEPSYAAVLHFVNCQDLRLEGFTAGHTQGAGMCTGSVLYFTDCTNVEAARCELYGCGTYGLELERCGEVRCVDSVVRDCSCGAISAANCSTVLMDGCTVYGIKDYSGCFQFRGCSGGAVINTLIRSCEGICLVKSDYSRVYLGGCEISGNRYEGVFSASVYPITVEGCAFRNNTTEGWYFDSWSTSERAVDPAGKTYEDFELAEMKLQRDLTWTPPKPEIPDTAPVEASEDGQIHVRNVDELLASLAPGVSIYLEDGVYDLSTAAGYGSYSGPYYYWMNCFDGPGLVIRALKDLHISAGGPHRATVTATPRYAEVLSFESCDGLSLSGFTAGHTQEPGDCAGGVLSFVDCNSATVRDCSLYGCGLLGVTAYGCKDMRVSYTEIHDCSGGAFSLTECDGVTLEHCNIHDISGPVYQLYACKAVTADDKALPDGTSNG